MQEVKNAVLQAQKELAQRYDFKGSMSSIELSGDEKLVLNSEDEIRMKAVLDVLQSKLIRRSVSLKCLEYKPLEPAQKGTVRQEIELKSGLESDMARQIVADIKALKLKVQAAIQAEQVRVSGKDKDDLQKVIAFLKAQEYKRPLQFTNYR
jgi:uncharacterized protein YajQ (UPF0234 family)